MTFLTQLAQVILIGWLPGAAIFRLSDHSRRLFASAKIYDMPIPYTVDDINAACRAVLLKAVSAKRSARLLAKLQTDIRISKWLVILAQFAASAAAKAQSSS